MWFCSLIVLVGCDVVAVAGSNRGHGRVLIFSVALSCFRTMLKFCVYTFIFVSHACLGNVQR